MQKEQEEEEEKLKVEGGVKKMLDQRVLLTLTERNDLLIHHLEYLFPPTG